MWGYCLKASLCLTLLTAASDFMPPAIISMAAEGSAAKVRIIYYDE